MFTSGLKETSSNTVEITDVDIEVMREFLNFLYTAECPSFTNSASELLVVAEKVGMVSHISDRSVWTRQLLSFINLF